MQQHDDTIISIICFYKFQIVQEEKYAFFKECAGQCCIGTAHSLKKAYSSFWTIKSSITMNITFLLAYSTRVKPQIYHVEQNK